MPMTCHRYLPQVQLLVWLRIKRGLARIMATDDDGDTLETQYPGADASSMSDHQVVEYWYLIVLQIMRLDQLLSDSDGGGDTNSSTQDITITITDIDDTAPGILLQARPSVLLRIRHRLER